MHQPPTSSTRRVFLRSGALTLLSLGAGPHFLDRLALAAERGPRPKTLVTIFLRGAMDGLMAVPPIDDPALPALRPHLAMSAARSAADPILDLGTGFGFHPAFAPLLPLWVDGRLAVIHAAGSPNPTRSHFDAQDFMETGTPERKGTPSGWLNRVAGESRRGEPSPFRVLSMTPQLPRALYGEEPALALADLKDFKIYLPWNRELSDRLASDLEDLYRHDDAALLKRRGGELFDALRTLSQDEVAAYRRERAGRYPKSKLGQSLMQIAYLIQAGVGLQIANAETEGWDTHVGQGTVRGPFARQAADFAESLAAFWEDIEPYQDDVVVLTMTEFGRTVHENGSAGTDHGHGSCMFVLGNRVDGGRIYGEFPERLDPDLLFEGRDLPVTTDFRAVFSEVAGKLFGIADDHRVFPGWDGYRLPLLW